MDIKSCDNLSKFWVVLGLFWVCSFVHLSFCVSLSHYFMRSALLFLIYVYYLFLVLTFWFIWIWLPRSLVCVFSFFSNSNSLSLALSRLSSLSLSSVLSPHTCKLLANPPRCIVAVSLSVFIHLSSSHSFLLSYSSAPCTWFLLPVISQFVSSCLLTFSLNPHYLSFTWVCSAFGSNTVNLTLSFSSSHTTQFWDDFQLF